MTAEIVLMNKSAVALAADSAVTVSANNLEKKVFNTATKVFTLSKYAPVGIMIYNGADFCGIPWETIIKDYRSKLGRKKFDTLEKYKIDFISYISSSEFFDGEVIKNHVMAIAYILLSMALKDKLIKSGVKAKELLSKHIDNLKEWDFVSGFNDDSAANLIRIYKKEIDAISKHIFSENKLSIQGCISICRQYIALYLTRNITLPVYSGIVIAGFGEKDIFPSLEAMKIDGFILGKVRISECENRKISLSNPSDIAPFAQTQMMDSVLLGALPSYNSDLLMEIYKTILLLPTEIINNISELSDDAKKEYLNVNQSAGIGLIKDIKQKGNYSVS